MNERFFKGNCFSNFNKATETVKAFNKKLINPNLIKQVLKNENMKEKNFSHSHFKVTKI